ncbi:MAG TPA: DUF502 domain-containing protein [Vicinamibacteria bacterium]|nr:DUF502 domain-containing protein [Vicinamibacteria bacterium]
MTAHRSLSRTIRNKFIAGLLIVIPIVLTVKALWWLLTYIDGLAAPLAEQMYGRPLPGIGFVITLAVVLAAGLLFSSGPLQQLLHGLEELVDSIPVVGSVYGTTKKVLSGFGKPEAQGAFKRFVFARLPGRTTPGFVTSTFHFTRADNTTYQLCAVYIPTNHLYVGDVVVLPLEDVIDIDLTVEDGVSILLSAGASMPAAITER